MKRPLFYLATLLAVCLGLVAATGRAAIRPLAPRWEYYAFVGGNINKERPKLDSLGAEGWELVSVVSVSDNFVSSIYLKRPLP